MKSIDLLYGSPFLCTCVKELWLLVQCAIEQLHELDALNSFWFYCNAALEMVRDGKSVYNDSAALSPTKLAAAVKLNNWTEFTIWLQCGVAKLHGFTVRGEFTGSVNPRVLAHSFTKKNYVLWLRFFQQVKDNYDFLENVIRNFFNLDPSEEQLRFTIFLLLPILGDWWSSRCEVLMICWEYFHKKLNSSFFLPGSAPVTLAVIRCGFVWFCFYN